MHTTQTLIIGGGQAGLALSRCLTDRDHDHLVVERGRIAERWHSERWNSLRLLTPNWMTRLPGHAYSGGDPDGFMTAVEVADFFAGYASSFRRTGHRALRGATSHPRRRALRRRHRRVDRTRLVHRRQRRRRHRLVRPSCDPRGRRASPADVPPGRAERLPPPGDLPAGGVLVVGASATGVQLADELHRSGRPVTLAVGSHQRLPRRYRGMDTFWWLDLIGAFDRTIDDVDDVAAARHEPSLQLVGRPDHGTLDLPALESAGVRLVGRVQAIDGQRVGLGADLAHVVAAADQRMARLLDRIDDAIDRLVLGSELLDPEPPTRVATTHSPASIDLAAEGITSVVWATGHRRTYDWLDLPILEAGEIRQRRGVTPFPGAYVLGQRFQHFRNSNFIDGVGRDAEFVADHISIRTRRRGTAGRFARTLQSQEK